MKIKGIYNMPGSRFYWYRWTQDGIRHAVSLKTDDLSEAVKTIAQIKAGELVAQWERKSEAPRTHLTTLVEDYLAKAQNRRKKPMRPRTVKVAKYVLMKFLKDKNIGATQEINHRTMEEWLGELKKAGRRPDTLNRYGNILRPFARYLVGKKLIAAGTFEIPERGAVGRKNWLSMDVANKVIAETQDPELRFILFCGFHAGLRKSEILAARVNWFDLGAGLLHVQNDPASGFILKDRENRVIPLTHEFKEFLAGFLGRRGSNSYVLRPGQESRGASEYRYDFKRAISSHFKRCGVKCSIHDMRRSFASNLVSRGVSIYKVARWLGDGVAVVERSYGHLAPADRDIDALSLA
jgi:integrase